MKDCVTPALVKRELKERIKKLLLGKTDAEDRVFIGRSIPTQVEKLPVLLIYTTGENISRFDESPKNYKRNLTVLIECIAAGDDDNDLDKRIETLGEQVESLMEVDETLGNILNKLELTGSDYQAEAEAQSPIGNLAIRFDLEFFTDAIRDGSQILESFKGMDVQWQIGQTNQNPITADQEPDAEDEINVAQT